ncbi:unnamed protein product [Arctia plantaginis]|uniref:Myogenesis-regulating glycosidase-like n=1 Tax=Arctia plantaginis TaxID=874455 RepID=A0A8S1AW93_ARCPL|nr:unnamed protein product [Arctia plantaginis]CAB3253994.1 unnamed protein product [Arctia plantaginis]
MAVLLTIVALLAVGTRAQESTVYVENPRDSDATLNLEPVTTGGFNAILVNGADRKLLGQIGRTLFSPFVDEEIEGGTLISYGTTNLTVNTLYDEEREARGIKFTWLAETGIRLEDCINFGTDHWYAGPMQVDQLYPIENAAQTYSANYNKETDNGAIMERYWLNSAGEYVYVHSEVPLFVDYKNLYNNHLCFGAQIANPYSNRRTRIVLAYDIWFLPDVKSAHKHAVDNYLGKPLDIPDELMVRHPIWSTWAQYSRDIDETKLLDFAQQILDNGFNNSQYEIDDQWEVCYGSLTVNQEKFPDFRGTVSSLKELGYRVTIWVHPFINLNCEPWYSEALNSGFFVLDESGSPNTTWWNNNGTVAGYIDFTNPRAAEWWYLRVSALLENYDIDSIKIDAGEASFAPEISDLTGDIELQPHILVQEYAKVCARFGKMIEVRSGFRNQDLPIFTRMVDRDSIWGLNNGLPTIITTTFQMNLNGYPFVLPDMIGGNGYNLDHDQADLPTKELFIRWVQANTFLPVMQFSFAPWNFDNQTVEISRKYVDLHAEYADVIIKAMEKAVSDGTPVNAPLWWLDPTDEDALVIWDEYLLAETILVAPILTEGATSRDIYLPAGTWFEEGDHNRTVEGPTWLRNYPAPLDTLPYFVKEVTESPNSQASISNSIFLVSMGIIFHYFFM